MPDEAYLAFVAKVDAFAARAHRGQSAFLHCKRGCDACCKVRRTATAVELGAVRTHLKHFSKAQHVSLMQRRARLDASGEERCVFLDDEGECEIYSARPLICRTHGPAVRLPDDALAWCALNFTGVDFTQVEDHIDSSTILSVELLNRTLALINAQYIAGTEKPPRLPLACALDELCP